MQVVFFFIFLVPNFSVGLLGLICFLEQRVFRKVVVLVAKLKGRRALLGVDAAILIAFFTATMITIYVAAPAIMSTLFGAIIGGPNGIYSYLLELPLLADPPGEFGTIGQQLGIPMVRVFGIMQTVALSLFGVVLVVAGICYVLENFRS